MPKQFGHNLSCKPFHLKSLKDQRPRYEPRAVKAGGVIRILGIGSAMEHRRDGNQGPDFAGFGRESADGIFANGRECAYIAESTVVSNNFQPLVVVRLDSSLPRSRIAQRAEASRATGTLKGEQET